MPMIDSLPDRPLTLKELQAIKQAGDYDLVQSGRPHPEEISSPTDETVELIVIVAEQWFKALNHCCDCECWHLALEGNRPERTDPQACYHLAISDL